MNQQEFDNSIQVTVNYFDVLGKPLTEVELYQYLFGAKARGVSFLEFTRLFKESTWVQKNLSLQRGIFVLKTEEKKVETRHNRVRVSIGRFKKVKRYLWLLHSAPFVDSLFLAGSVPISNSKDSSDIDFFLVTQSDRIWIGRLWITLLTHIFRVRRHGNKDANRFCLNHYVTDENLYRDDHDVYSAELYSDYFPLKYKDPLFKDFQKSNTWTRAWFPHIPQRDHRLLRYQGKAPLKTLGETLLGGSFGNQLEKLLGRIQSQKIMSNPKTVLEKSRVFISDYELEFHPVPNGLTYGDKLNQRLSFDPLHLTETT
jgi:hypothetical protein